MLINVIGPGPDVSVWPKGRYGQIKKLLKNESCNLACIKGGCLIKFVNKESTLNKNKFFKEKKMII